MIISYLGKRLNRIRQTAEPLADQEWQNKTPVIQKGAIL